MRIITCIALVVICFACKRKKETTSKEMQEAMPRRIVKSEFQTLIDSNGVRGAILIYDLHKNIYYSNDFARAERGNLPASTFKIANSIIGLETGVIENDSVIFEWDGKKKWLKEWEQDLILRDAFQFSCVPCYQQVARKVGPERMHHYVAKLNYGNVKMDATNIDKFWLEGESRISPMQQIDFLKRFYKNELPISKKTSEIVKRIMRTEEKDEYKISGKTGLSKDNQSYNGWYVGYLETPQNTYLFATNLEPRRGVDLDTFINKRIDVTKSAFKSMKVDRKSVV